jgi:hypothetical protein
VVGRKPILVVVAGAAVERREIRLGKHVSSCWQQLSGVDD